MKTDEVKKAKADQEKALSALREEKNKTEDLKSEIG